MLFGALKKKTKIFTFVAPYCGNPSELIAYNMHISDVFNINEINYPV